MDLLANRDVRVLKLAEAQRCSVKRGEIPLARPREEGDARTQEVLRHQVQMSVAIEVSEDDTARALPDSFGPVVYPTAENSGAYRTSPAPTGSAPGTNSMAWNAGAPPYSSDRPNSEAGRNPNRE